MKKTILLFALVFTVAGVFAQKKTTTSATINFDATTSLDALPKAENKTAIAAFDTKTGNVRFEAAIKDFNFANPKIQEHFNGKQWMSSDEFPKASFKGTASNIAAVNFKKDGTYTVDVTGDLTIHGVTKSVTTKATVVVSGKSFNATSSFTIKLDDYGINGGAIAAGKVSKEPTITVAADFK